MVWKGSASALHRKIGFVPVGAHQHLDYLRSTQPDVQVFAPVFPESVGSVQRMLDLVRSLLWLLVPRMRLVTRSR